jgi:hypothetical protein
MLSTALVIALLIVLVAIDTGASGENSRDDEHTPDFRLSSAERRG